MNRLIEKISGKKKAPTKSKKLIKWQERLSHSRGEYESELKRIKEREAYYDGTRDVLVDGVVANKKASNIRNIVYELIETQVDNSIPMPKVTPRHEEDIELARVIEKALQNELRTLKFKAINDLQERTVPIQGGDFFLIEWSNDKGYHSTIGDIKVTTLHPRQVIPQSGISEINDMDYIFVQIPQTKEYVKSKYGIDVEDESEEFLDSRCGDCRLDDLVTINIAYYKNDDGIGRFAWVNDYVLEDLSDFMARHIDKCPKCGKSDCDCKVKKEKIPQYEETLLSDMKLNDGSLLEASIKGEELAKDYLGNAMLDELGNPIMTTKNEVNKIPYYKIDEYPLIIRRNVSRWGRLLGCSDIDAIADQQETIKKLGTKINEKILKGGSYITLPEDVSIETTDEELKVLRIADPQQKSLIDVITVQADTTQDRYMTELNYEWARSTLGITNSFQGKYDASATSGVSKQYSINQSAGRLESKRSMKNEAYSELYELMFKFWISYADGEIPISYQNSNGQMEFDKFDRYKFLKRDSAGALYWNDEFIFETDPTSTIMANREAMWSQADFKLQSGAFGPLGDLRTLYLYWGYMEKNNYPNAGEVKRNIEQRLAEEEQMKQMMQEQAQTRDMQQVGGGQGEMPIM